MFGWGTNPHYFANPPAFTYLLHCVFAVWFGGRRGRLARATPSHPTEVFVLARVTAALLGTLAVWLLYLAGARLFDRARRPARGGAGGGRVPAGLLRAPRAQRRADAGAAHALAAGDRRGAAQRPRARLSRSPGSDWGWGARPSTPPGSCSRRCSRRPPPSTSRCDAAAGRDRMQGSRQQRRRSPGTVLAGLALAGAAALAAFLLANPYARARLPRLPRRDSRTSRRSPTKRRASSARPTRERHRLLPVVADLGPRLGAGAGRARRRGHGLVARARASAGCSCRRRSLYLAFMGAPGALLRALAAADLPDRVPARGLLRACSSPLARGPGGRWPASGSAERARRAAGAIDGRRSPVAPVARAAPPDGPQRARGARAVRAGALYSVHSGLVLSRADTRNLTRAWMVAHVPAGARRGRRAGRARRVGAATSAIPRSPPATGTAGSSTPRWSR